MDNDYEILGIDLSKKLNNMCIIYIGELFEKDDEHNPSDLVHIVTRAHLTSMFTHMDRLSSSNPEMNIMVHEFMNHVMDFKKIANFLKDISTISQYPH
jgi:hypothetical protein